jgi:hypothetical protein
MRQMPVACRRRDRLVAEQPLNGVQVDPGFEEMGREGVPQRILTLPMNRPQRSFAIVTIHFTANG